MVSRTLLAVGMLVAASTAFAATGEGRQDFTDDELVKAFSQSKRNFIMTKSSEHVTNAMLDVTKKKLTIYRRVNAPGVAKLGKKWQDAEIASARKSVCTAPLIEHAIKYNGWKVSFIYTDPHAAGSSTARTFAFDCPPPSDD